MSEIIKNGIEGGSAHEPTKKVSAAMKRVGKLCTYVRERVLGKNKSQLAADCTMDFRSVLNMERGAIDPKFYSRLVQHLRNGAGIHLNEEKTEALELAIERMLDGLVDHERVKTQAYAWRLLLREGTEIFESKTGLERNTLHKRRDTQSVTPARDLVGYAEALGDIPADLPPEEFIEHPAVARARDAWRRDVIKILAWPPLTARLLSWVTAAKFDTDDNGLVRAFGLPRNDARVLSTGGMVSSASVEKMIDVLRERGLIPAEEAAGLLRSWKEWEQEHQQRGPQTGSEKIHAILEKRGLENRFVADLLGTPRSSSDYDRRAEPAREARRGNFSPLASAHDLSILCASSRDEFEELLEAARTQEQEHLQHKGSKLQPVYVERLLYGLNYKDLAQTFQEDEIQRFERGRSSSLERAEDLETAMRAVARNRARGVIERWLQHFDVQTLTGALHSFSETTGLVPISEAARMSPKTVDRMIKGEIVPDLATLKKMFARAHRPLSPAVEIDWRLQWAEKNGEKEGSSLLSRSLNLLVAESYRNSSQFFKEQSVPLFVAREGWKQIQREGTVQPKVLRIFLKKLGVKRNDPAAVFTKIAGKHTTAMDALSAWTRTMVDRKNVEAPRAVAKARQWLIAQAAAAECTNNRKADFGTLLEKKFAVQRALDTNEFDAKSIEALAALRMIPGVTLEELLEADLGAYEQLEPSTTEKPRLKLRDARILAEKVLERVYHGAPLPYRRRWHEWTHRVLKDVAIDAVVLHRGNTHRALLDVQHHIDRMEERRERYTAVFSELIADREKKGQQVAPKAS